MSANVADEDRNEDLIRYLYSLAEASSKDAQEFASLFKDDGYFYHIADGARYCGSEVGIPVERYCAAFPDIHRELCSFYFDDNVVVVELALSGTHKGDLVLGTVKIPATGRRINAPCCDVIHIKDGKITSLHSYLPFTVILAQLTSD